MMPLALSKLKAESIPSKLLLLSCREEAKSREDAARALLQHILVPAQAAALLVAIHPVACDVAMLWQLLLRAPCQ